MRQKFMKALRSVLAELGRNEALAMGCPLK